MEAIRRVVDSGLLNSVVPLPEYFQDRKVEIIVFPAEEKNAPSAVLPFLTMAEIDKMMKGSTTESLIGSLPNRGVSLEEYQAERLKKYESAD